MTYDEIFVAQLKLVPLVVSLCSTRVYHLEVFQNNPSIARYPCVVYSLSDDAPEEEIGENPGFYTATYSVIVIAKNSSDMRRVAEGIKHYFNLAANIDAVSAATECMIPWMSATGDSEENLFAIEQQEKGFRTANLQVAIDHWQVAPV